MWHSIARQTSPRSRCKYRLWCNRFGSESAGLEVPEPEEIGCQLLFQDIRCRAGRFLDEICRGDAEISKDYRLSKGMDRLTILRLTIFTQTQLLSMCIHSLFLCAPEPVCTISLGARDLEDSETEYTVQDSEMRPVAWDLHA